MKDKEIERIKKEVTEAQKEDFPKQIDALNKIVQNLGLSAAFRENSSDQLFIQKMVEKVHTHLQTETMINTVKVAKWSCLWAAVAATVSLITVSLSVVTVILSAITVILSIITLW